MTKQSQIIADTNATTALIYKPLPVVIERAEGAWVWDVEGNRYLDCLSAYSAVNQGHCHPKILQAMQDQMYRVTLTSRAFHNDQMGLFLRKLCDVANMDKAIPMNTGAEAVETAIKAARLWGYQVKKVPDNMAEIIVCTENFHGRTTTVISFSSEESYKDGFGPFTPGFKIVRYGDIDAMRAAVTENTVAIMLEPIQGEAGVIIPPEGYLSSVRDLCDQNRLLMILDEIQTGLGRTGKMFAFEHEEGVRPDLLTVGKALSGGAYPVSACLGSNEVMDLFHPGMHGSTFGGNPLASAVGLAALDVLIDECLVDKAAQQGTKLMAALQGIHSDVVTEIRGKGLFIAIELKTSARSYCEALMREHQILAKETHDNTIRIAPPLIIDEDQIGMLIDGLRSVLS